MIVEACVETLEESILAEQRGATRLELCSHLEVDGLTPDTDLVKDVLQKVSIPVRVMVRPIAGDFVYNLREMETMIQTIEEFRSLGVEGVVFGMLKAMSEENSLHETPGQERSGDTLWQLDLPAIKELTSFASPLKVTIHKCVDLTPNPVSSVRELLTIPGITSILTSGGLGTAREGAETLIEMIEVAGSSIEIIAAGKILADNLQELHAQLSSPAYHGRKIV